MVYFSGMSLLQRFRRHISSLALEPGRTLVAVSGGPDSVALLDLLDRSPDAHGLALTVAHVDHGIHPASAEVAAAVASRAAELGLPYEAERLALGPDAGETAARAGRYAALERIRLRSGAIQIMTGHHADDQAETVLMRVLRGSGPAGMAAMAAQAGLIVRPLLPFRRQELAAYLRERGLDAWSDPANREPRHLRSWIRHSVLPGIESRLPDVAERLGVTARQAARDRRAWDAVLALIPMLDPLPEDGGISVAASALADYDSPLACAVVGALGRRTGCTIGERRAELAVALARAGKSGTSLPLGAGWQAQLAFGRLRIVPEALPTVLEPLAFASFESGGVWGRWRFTSHLAEAPPHQERRSLTAWFPIDSVPSGLIVRAPREGDRIAPLGGPGRRLLVRCFQDARVPRARRGAWPVIESAGTAVWVPGVCRADALLPPAGSEAFRVDATYA